MSATLIFSDDLINYDYGPSHPMKVQRLKLTMELMEAYGMLEGPDIRVESGEPCTREDLLRFHTEDYIGLLEALNGGEAVPGIEKYGIGRGDNPVFKGLMDWSRIIVGGSLLAARLVSEGKADIAFNIAGGLHHARKDRAAGFCYVNDPVIIIMKLIEQGYRVAYLDVDVHHGDGVQWAFYDSNQVLTISIHQDGRTLFPGMGEVQEIGRGAGTGYSLNVPLWPGADDWLFLRAYDEAVDPILEAFNPDIVVTQLGVDTFHGDPLGSLDLTTHGFVRLMERLKARIKRWVALGGGGYEMTNVARGWTLAWAVMTGLKPDDEIPEPVLTHLREKGFERTKLRDDFFLTGVRRELAEEHLDTTLRQLQKMFFPIHGL